MKYCYTPKKFNAQAEGIIFQANQFIEEYQAMHLCLTLRQLYYRFIATDTFPDKWLVQLPTGQLTKNHLKNYKKLTKLINDARLAGFVDWSAFEDRTRELTQWQTDSNPKAALNRVIRSFRLDPWLSQDNYVEIWVEKEALEGVFEPVSRKFLCPLFCCRGYHSASSAYEAAMRIEGIRDQGKQVTILHFGDHDPSGLDMTRDIGNRFDIFQVEGVQINRCALNMDQINLYNPPPSPAKITDSRAQGYIEEFGQDSWELDALSPVQLQQLATEEIENLVDPDIWQQTKEDQEEAVLRFREFGETFEN